jgi:iron-sulfur cluster assembly protein
LILAENVYIGAFLMIETLPEGVRLGNHRLVELTETSAEKIISLLANEPEGSVLRIKITGGGCNGLSYKLKFVNSFKHGDILVESIGAQVVVDSKSALYLRGTTLNYSNALVAGGFKFENPNAKSSCSCGESFSV